MKRTLFTVVGLSVRILPRIAPLQNAVANWNNIAVLFASLFIVSCVWSQERPGAERLKINSRAAAPTEVAGNVIVSGEAESSGDGHCTQLNHLVVSQVADGETKQAEAALSKALASSSSRREGVCAGLMLNDLAAIMLNSGRLADAETFAERALTALRKSYSSNNPVLLRPFQILCSARFQQGKIGAARRAFEQMRSIPAVRAEDRALVHGLAAPLFAAEDKDREAETEYLAALNALEQAGRIYTADAATAFGALGSLYIRQQRFEEARRTLDRAWGIFTTAKDTVPADLIRLLSIRAGLHTNLAEWRDAETDLRDAISLADHERQMDPVMINSLFTTYALVLRKTHRRRESRYMETRIAALQHEPAAVVDVSELLQRSKLRNEK
jgi:tetratricopeptide (TPR) repeat protein